MHYRGGARRVQNLTRNRDLRHNLTDAERVLWHLLRTEAFNEWKFRRQHSFGPYILDFFCPSERLAIEVDGGHHYSDSAELVDALRSQLLELQGVRVLRFSNSDVLNNRVAVAEAILLALRKS
jgi:very-short-patch-repair endonuclease